jgi:hypothetical protein
MYELDLFLIQVAMSMMLSAENGQPEPEYFLAALLDAFNVTGFFNSEFSADQVISLPLTSPVPATQPLAPPSAGPSLPSAYSPLAGVKGT